MSATFVISTSSVDRGGDLVVPGGIQLEHYAKNPIVLWEHGFSGYSLPIGKSEGPEGKLAISVGEGAVFGTCYFTHKSRESEQIFELVQERIVRAASVRIGLPYKAETRRDGEQSVTVISEWPLEEWSLVCVPMNQDCVAPIIAKNRLAGSQITEPLLKSLKRYAPATTKHGKGADFDKPKDKPVAEKSKTKAAAEEEKPEDEKPADDAAAPAADDAAPEEEEGDKSAGESPLGAQILSALHGSMGELMGQASAAAKLLEQPSVKEFVGKFCEECGAKVAEIEGMYSTNYSDLPALAAKAEGDAVPNEDVAMKSWLQNSPGAQLQLAGYGARLKSLLKSKSLAAGEKVIVQGVLKHLERMATLAKQAPPPPGPEVAALAEVKQQFADLTKKLADIAPHNPSKV